MIWDIILDIMMSSLAVLLKKELKKLNLGGKATKKAAGKADILLRARRPRSHRLTEQAL